MKDVKLFILLTFFLIVNPLVSQSQTLAVTELGDTIYVYDNGTWSFEVLEEMPEISELDFLNEELTIDTVRTPFVYSKSAKKVIENKNNLFKIFYDDNEWERIPPAQLNEDAEFAFKSKSRDIWCVVISEETSIEAAALLRVAKKMMKDNTGGEITVLKTEARTVNGVEVIRGVLGAKISGMSLTFDTYYFSNDEGSVQFTTWTSDNVWKNSEDTILDLLNGFVVE